MRPNVWLWTLPGLLAALFLCAGGMKLVLPVESLAGPVSLPAGLLRFIGVAEVLGAVGLILPGLLQIQPALTCVAASGLVIIMAGATGVTLLGGGQALVPVIVGLMAVGVALGRARVPPLGAASKVSVPFAMPARARR